MVTELGVRVADCGVGEGIGAVVAGAQVVMRAPRGCKEQMGREASIFPLGEWFVVGMKAEGML